MAYPDLPVYAFTGDTYTGFYGTSDAQGKVVFTLPEGSYRFRADLDIVGLQLSQRILSAALTATRSIRESHIHPYSHPHAKFASA